MTNLDKIERVLNLSVPCDRVWNALTTAQGLSGWFSDRAEIDLRVGGKLVLEWNEAEYGKCDGVVEVVDPPNTFAFRWLAYGMRHAEEFTPENSTLVTFTLEPTGDGTRLTMLETGFAGLSPELHGISKPENERGWTVELQELVDYLAMPESV